MAAEIGIRHMTSQFTALPNMFNFKGGISSKFCYSLSIITASAIRLIYLLFIKSIYNICADTWAPH